LQTPLQLACPTAQLLLTQAPAVHVAPTGQTSPHPPQFKGSLVGSTQPPSLQSAVGAVHFGGTHFPSVHVSPSAQVPPQIPQFSGSLVISTHLPWQGTSSKLHDSSHAPVPTTVSAAMRVNPTLAHDCNANGWMLIVWLLVSSGGPALGHGFSVVRMIHATVRRDKNCRFD
jgi:hypothetical protein